ncbi:MAG: spermidine/putrescine ABC transporter substrate-binding protein [Firmicutes bacterium]|nr:spermidine/putrescine ABC transporter substrate-binding protein [Bacillota bacterium]
MKKILTLLLCLVMVLGLLTGCGGGDSEGDVTTSEMNLFTWDGMFPQEVLDEFEAETGIRIYYSNFDTDEAMLAKLEETQGGDYDLVIADDYIIELAIAEGLVQKLDKSKISTYENLNPLYMGQFYDPADEYTVPWGAGIPLIVYNPALTGFELTGYEDLWNPALKDNLALIGNYRVLNGITLKTMGESMNVDDVAKIEAAGEKLKALAPNVRVISDSNTQDFLISEEVAAAFMYTSQVNLAMTSRDDLKLCYPKEGLGFGIMAAFVPSQAPNADAAHQFLDFLNRPEVAAKCFEYLGYYCTNKAAEEHISDAMYDLLVVPETVTEGEIIQNISQEGEDAHAKVWNEFKAACGQ